MWDCGSDGGGGASGRGQRRDEEWREWRYAASPHDETGKSEPDSPRASQKHSSSDVFHRGHRNTFDSLVLLQHRAVNQDQCWCFYIQREENMSVFTKLRWSQKKFFPPRLEWAGRNHWDGSLRTRTSKIRRICRAGSQREEEEGEGECLFVIWVNWLFKCEIIYFFGSNMFWCVNDSRSPDPVDGLGCHPLGRPGSCCCWFQSWGWFGLQTTCWLRWWPGSVWTCW